MQKYRKGVEKKFSTDKKVHPAEADRRALVDAQFASDIRTEFMDKAYGEIMCDLFIEWLSTEFHEEKKREYIYNTALSLGSVKQRLISYETYGRNVPAIEKSRNQEETDNG